MQQAGAMCNKQELCATCKSCKKEQKITQVELNGKGAPAVTKSKKYMDNKSGKNQIGQNVLYNS